MNDNLEIPDLYGHTSSTCPFLDLSDQCIHCKTPGRFLKGGMHFYAQPEKKYDHCVCCDKCEYTQFVKQIIDSKGIHDLVSLISAVNVARFDGEGADPIQVFESRDWTYDYWTRELERVLCPDESSESE